MRDQSSASASTAGETWAEELEKQVRSVLLQGLPDTVLDTPTPREGALSADSELAQAEDTVISGERLPLGIAMHITNMVLKGGRKVDMDLIKDMPSVKRRCLEERIIDVAMDAIYLKGLTAARNQLANVAVLQTIYGRTGKVVDGFMASALSQVKWQVILQKEGTAQGEVWADLQDVWAGDLEDIFHLVSDWTDYMWSRVLDADAPPQVRGSRFGFPDYVVEFHKGGAVQINIRTTTQRTVRRVVVAMGSGVGSVSTDPGHAPYSQCGPRLVKERNS